MLSSYDRWLTTDPREEVGEYDCGVCGERAELEAGERPAAWGTVEYARHVVPVCSLECAASVVLDADEGDRVAALRWVWEQLTRSDEYLPVQLGLRGGKALVGTLVASAGEHLTVEDADTGGLSIVPWDRVERVGGIDI